MTTPEKYYWMVRFRKWADSFVMDLKLPNINPDIVSYMSVFLMVVAFINPKDDLWIFVFVLGAMLLDWLDGVIARMHNRVTRRGYWIDMICDRISEAIIAVYSPLLWLPLFLVNIFLTLLQLKSRVQFVLPIRLTFLIFLIFNIFGIAFGWI